MKPDKNRIPVVMLERYVLDELESGQREEIDKLLREDESLRSEVEIIKKTNREILDRYPPVKIAEDIRKRAESAGTSEPGYKKAFRMKLPAVFGFMGLATALLILFLAQPFFRTPVPGTGMEEFPDTVRFKGDATRTSPYISIFRKLGDSTERLENGSTVRVHDEIQLSYNALNRKYGTIFSIDGRGNVTLHYPASPGKDILLENKGEVFLRNSFELDDAPYFEKFYFITSDTDFDLNSILEQARHIAVSGKSSENTGMELPSHFSQTTLLLVKEKNH